MQQNHPITHTLVAEPWTRSQTCMLALLCGIPLLDVLTSWSPIFGATGAILSMLSILPFVWRTQTSIRSLLTSAGQGKLRWSLLILLTLVLVGILGAFDPRLLWDEYIYETGCAYLHLLRSPDAGFHAECHYGYPARAYYWFSIPSLAFGPSVLALNVAVALFFAAALILFVDAISREIEDHPNVDLITAFALLLALQGGPLRHLPFIYEQTVFPVGWAMIGCALWLDFRRRRDRDAWLLLTLLLLQLAYAYPPALPILVGLLALLGADIWMHRNRAEWKYLGLSIGVPLVACALSLRHRHDLRLFHVLFHKDAYTLRAVVQSIPNAVGTYDLQMHWIAGMLVRAAYLLPAFALRLGGGHFSIATWSLLTTFAAMGTGGITFYGQQNTYRFLVIFPVLAFTIALYCSKRLSSKRAFKPALLMLNSVFLLLIIIETQIEYRGHTRPPRAALVDDVVRQLPADFLSERNIRFQLWTGHRETNEFHYFPEYLEYFYPQFHSNYTSECKRERGPNVCFTPGEKRDFQVPGETRWFQSNGVSHGLRFSNSP